MDYANPINLIITGIYYLSTIVLSFFSIFAVYTLVRYGQSRAFSLIVAACYSAVFLGFLGRSYLTLQLIK